MVKADAGGTGKYLTINIDGQGSVNALKEKTGESWDFPPLDTVKVGAGTVLLTATAAEGWEFSEWTGDIANLADPSDAQTTFKTTKLAIITAVFVRTQFKIAVTPWGDGAILLNGDSVSGDIYFDAGETPEFTFVPYDDPFTPEVDNYVSSIKVNENYLTSYVPSYTFPAIYADQTLDVYFSEEGTAIIPPGDGVVFLNPDESLVFENAGAGGTATVGDLEPSDEQDRNDYAYGSLAAGWIINVDIDFDQVTITLQYDPNSIPSGVDESDLRLVRGETLEAVLCDVNGDLVVNGDDVSDVANAVKHLEWYEAVYDVNNDGFVNEDDVHVVNANKGAVLEDITDWVDTENDLIYGITDEFSIFGVR
jgi:hypothetical protein